MSTAMAFVLQGSWDEQPVGSTPKMTSSTTRPPGFVECYICQKEFGSRSIEIHEPQCLEKWRARNSKLPKSRRERTPSPSKGHPLHAGDREDMSPTPAAYTPTSDPDELSTSWSHPGQPPSKPENGRPRSASFSEGRRKVRPSTATLEKPKVLDMNLRHEVDMSEMTRKMLDQLILTKETQGGSSDYSSDFTSSSPSSLGSKSPFDDEATSEGSEGEPRKARPSTMRLPRPSRHIAVPVITAQNSRPSKKTSNLRSFLPRGRRRQLDDAFTGPKDKVKIPEPCQTCGKEQNPERFHSHPLDIPKFKAKGDERGKTSKLIVTKPTALKYKSRSVDEENKAPPVGRKSRLKPPSSRKSRSMESSPVPAKKAEGPKNPPVPLRKFMRDQKASMNKEKDFTVEIFDAESSLTPRSEDNSPPAQRKQDAKQNGENDRRRNQGAPPPPRHMTKIEEERESRPERTNNKTRRSSEGKKGPPRLTGTAPTLVCYICGREFGSRSLAIHQPQCIEKWRRENEKLPRNLQRPEPEPPEHELTHEEWNEYAWKTAQAQLVPCEWCGRTFFPERLEVHQRGCKPPPGAPKKPQKATPTDAPTNLNSSLSVSKPTVVCYICGREFGSLSINIHEPQCLKKWRIQNEALPGHLKRPEPQKPETIYSDDGKVDKEAMAEAAWKTHLETLVACHKCGRTFFPDRLIVHQKACQ